MSDQLSWSAPFTEPRPESYPQIPQSAAKGNLSAQGQSGKPSHSHRQFMQQFKISLKRLASHIGTK